jgi:hypothetical protein
MTPEQFRDIEGRELSDDAAVYVLTEHHPYGPGWTAGSYRHALYQASQFVDFGFKTYIVCAYNLIEPPSVGWRPE